MPKGVGGGGKRPGAGRPKGVRNRAIVERARKAALAGLTPLEYLLSIVRNPDLPDEARRDAAKAAAPYVHPRLSTVEMTGRMEISHEERLKRLK